MFDCISLFFKNDTFKWYVHWPWRVGRSSHFLNELGPWTRCQENLLCVIVPRVPLLGFSFLICNTMRDTNAKYFPKVVPATNVRWLPIVEYCFIHETKVRNRYFNYFVKTHNQVEWEHQRSIAPIGLEWNSAPTASSIGRYLLREHRGGPWPFHRNRLSFCLWTFSFTFHVDWRSARWDLMRKLCVF